MTFTAPVGVLIDAANAIVVDGYADNSIYDDFDGIWVVELIDGQQTCIRFDFEQQVEVDDDGDCMVTDVDGQEHIFSFGVRRAITQGDL